MSLAAETRQNVDNKSDLSCRQVLFALTAIVVIVLAVYSNSLDCSWHFDDEPNITHNSYLQIRDLSWASLKQTLFSDQRYRNVLYRPMAAMSFALNYYCGGDDVFGYHVVNVLIHLLTSVFLFLFLRLTLDLPSTRDKYARHAYAIALLSTVLWSLNPVHTQAITYIVQRMASMAGLFYILCMLLYVKARTSPSRYGRIIYYFLGSLSFLLALGSKENAVMVPLSLFLYEILLLREDGWKFLRKNAWYLGVIGAVVAIVGFGYLHLLGDGLFSFLNGYANRPFSFCQRMLTEGRVVVFYITLLLYPVPNRLNIAHDFALSTSIYDPMSTLFAFAFIALLVVLSVLAAKRSPLVSFAVLFFFLNHLIESSILPLELVFEHRNYIPSFFFFVPWVIGFFFLFDHYASKKVMPFVLASFMILLLIGYGHSTFIRNFAWKNEGTLWLDALEKEKALPRIYTNLGRYYQNVGDSEQAALNYQKAIDCPAKIQTDEHYVSLYNLGAIWGERGNFEKAIEYYFRSLMKNPNFAAPYNNLAIIMDKRGKRDLAQRYLTSGYRLNPHSLEINYNLGTFFVKWGNPDKAIFHLEKIVHEKKTKDSALFYLGIAHKQKGQMVRAAHYFKAALAENPRNLIPRLHLIEVWVELGKIVEARAGADLIVKEMFSSEKLENQVFRALSSNGKEGLDRPSASLIIPLLVQALDKNSVALEELKAKFLDRINLS
jgi:tetratricopeptide (TPR) repeat protein